MNVSLLKENNKIPSTQSTIKKKRPRNLSDPEAPGMKPKKPTILIQTFNKYRSVSPQGEKH